MSAPKLRLAGINSAAKRAAKTRELRREILEIADAGILAHIQPLVDQMVKLAMGGFRQDVDTYQPAGLVQIEDIARDAAGNILRNRQGDAIRIKVPAYPDLEPDTLVMTSRKTSVAAPDRQAIADLLNRAVGKPREAAEAPAATKEKLPDVFKAMLDRAYGDAEEAHAAPAEETA